MEKTPIIRACEIVGSQKALADILCLAPSTINQWVSNIRPIPTERCPAIELAAAGQVTRRDLRPDDWWMIWPELVTEEFPAPQRTTREAD